MILTKGDLDDLEQRARVGEQFVPPVCGFFPTLGNYLELLAGYRRAIELEAELEALRNLSDARIVKLGAEVERLSEAARSFVGEFGYHAADGRCVDCTTNGDASGPHVDGCRVARIEKALEAEATDG